MQQWLPAHLELLVAVINSDDVVGGSRALGSSRAAELFASLPRPLIEAHVGSVLPAVRLGTRPHWAVTDACPIVLKTLSELSPGVLASLPGLPLLRERLRPCLTCDERLLGCSETVGGLARLVLGKIDLRAN